MHSTTIARRTSHLGFAIAPHFVSILGTAVPVSGRWRRFCQSNTFPPQCHSAGDPTLSARSWCMCRHTTKPNTPPILCAPSIHRVCTRTGPSPHTTSPCPCLPLFRNTSPTPHACMCPVRRVCAPPTRPYAPPVPPAHIPTAMPFPPTFHVHSIHSQPSSSRDT
ncbi:hypothetical protein B0H14DRAFT_2920900 [Mycena olivaceomarginata]|nr:hypothetical protein B0H14DRAFT_2920900 [Mycena olivaceomarginata]